MNSILQTARIFCLMVSLAAGIVNNLNAQCVNGQVPVSLTFEGTGSGCDLSYYIYSSDYVTFYHDGNFYDATTVTDEFCLPDDVCFMVILYYDGFEMNFQIPYHISINAEEVAQGTLSNWSETLYLNCPSGSLCQSPLILDEGLYTTVSDDTWYIYTPAVTGMFHISTCLLNTCDTKVWVYETCPWNAVEGPPGTYAYNDNGECGLQADTDIMLEAGVSYLIRVGDNEDACSDPIPFEFYYVGDIIGCMDETACNYNPIAQAEGDCLYFPDPNCSAPDLVMNVDVLLTSMTSTMVNATPCDVEEGIVTGEGQRNVITFAVRIDNVGDADYYIGDPSNNPEMFETQNCHGHVHYAGYGDYRLMDMQGNIIPAGHKNGFCVMDLCGFGQYNCGMMGISAGCYDQYGAGTSGQWFDVTDVSDGTYRGLVTVNPLHLADGLGRQESNYENNTYVFCFDLYTDGNGMRQVTLLSDCPPFIDCMGVENGTAQLDCNGICDGPSIWGDVVSDTDLNTDDLTEYLNFLAQESLTVTTCNDLSANGSLTIYDLALANVCIGESEQGGTSACNFPHNILSTSGPVGLAITNVNFMNGYIDVEIKSPLHDISGYQFSIDGITISSVTSLVGDIEFPCAVSFNPYNNQVFGLGEFGYAIENSSIGEPLVRIYYSEITSNLICISGIVDIATSTRSRTSSYIYGNCFDATEFSTNEIYLRGEIEVFPNPASDVINIRFSRYSILPERLIVRNTVGQIVEQIRVPSGSDQFSFDLNKLASGSYTMESVVGNETGRVVRFVKL